MIITADLLKQWAAQALSMRPYPNEMFPPSPYDKIQDDDLHPSCGWGVVLYQWSKVADDNRKRVNDVKPNTD